MSLEHVHKGSKAKAKLGNKTVPVGSIKQAEEGHRIQSGEDPVYCNKPRSNQAGGKGIISLRGGLYEIICCFIAAVHPQ